VQVASGDKSSCGMGREIGEVDRSVGPDSNSTPFPFNQMFSNGFKFEPVKDGLLLLENFETRYGCVEN
jgi:hypothetical protein